MPPKTTSPSMPKRPRIARTNAEKIAVADHKRALAQKKANRPASKKRRTLPPPEEMEAAIEDAATEKKAKALVAARKTAIRQTQALTNALKIAAAKKVAEMRKKKALKSEGVQGEIFGPKQLKEMIAKELGFRQEPEKKAKVISEDKKAKVVKKKVKSCFDMVMEQDEASQSVGAFVGVGRKLGETVEKKSDGGEAGRQANGREHGGSLCESDGDADGEESGDDDRGRDGQEDDLE